MSGGNFASLTGGLLVRKGEAKPPPIMPSEIFRLAQRAVQTPVDVPIPAEPTPRSERGELSAPSTVADLPATPRRMFVGLSAKEYEALGLVAVKKGTTPQHLMRKALHDFLAEFVESATAPALASGPVAISSGSVVTRGRAAR